MSSPMRWGDTDSSEDDEDFEGIRNLSSGGKKDAGGGGPRRQGHRQQHHGQSQPYRDGGGMGSKRRSPRQQNNRKNKSANYREGKKRSNQHQEKDWKQMAKDSSKYGAAGAANQGSASGPSSIEGNSWMAKRNEKIRQQEKQQRQQQEEQQKQREQQKRDQRKSQLQALKAAVTNLNDQPSPSRGTGTSLQAAAGKNSSPSRKPKPKRKNIQAGKPQVVRTTSGDLQYHIPLDTVDATQSTTSGELQPDGSVKLTRPKSQKQSKKKGGNSKNNNRKRSQTRSTVLSTKLEIGANNHNKPGS